MRLQQLLDEAESRRTERENRRASEQAERERLSAAALAERAAAFREWLGELAQDFEITNERWVEGGIALSLRPTGWRFGVILVRVANPGEDAGVPEVAFYGSNDTLRVQTPHDARLGEFFADRQREYMTELKRVIAEWQDSLYRPHLTGEAYDDDYQRLAERRDLLKEASPERAAEWDDLYDQSLRALDEMVAPRQQAAAERTAALGRYREALRAWFAQRDEVKAHNQAIRAALLERLGEVSLVVRELEYAVVAEDDGGRYVETRMAWVKETDGDRAAVMEDGRARWWTLRHVVRVGEPITLRSESPHNHLFLFNSRLLVWFTEPDEDIVLEATARLREMPDEPSWDDVSGGMTWRSDVDKARGDVFNEARAAQVEVD